VNKIVAQKYKLKVHLKERFAMKKINKDINYPENLAIELGFEEGKLNDDQLLGVNHIVCGLTSREKEIIYHRFVEHKTFKEVGKDMDLSDTRVRSILVKTISNINKDKNLVEYIENGLHKQKRIIKRRAFIKKCAFWKN